MMRLIDADALIREANSEGAYGYVDAAQISKAPTIEAKPIIFTAFPAILRIFS